MIVDNRQIIIQHGVTLAKLAADLKVLKPWEKFHSKAKTVARGARLVVGHRNMAKRSKVLPVPAPA